MSFVSNLYVLCSFISTFELFNFQILFFSIIQFHNYYFSMSQPANTNQVNEDDQVIPVARAPAKTYDSITTHFGERITSLREMCKRYQNYGRFTIGVPSNPTNLANVVGGLKPLIDLRPIFIKYSNTSQLQVTPGTIGFCSPMYRAIRGPLTFKIKVTGVNQSQAVYGWVGFIPYVPDQYPQTPDQLSAFVDEIPFDNGGMPTLSNCVPLAYFSPNQTAEFKVPYTNHNAIALLPNAYDSLTNGLTMDDYASFVLVVYVYANITAVTSKVQYNLQYALGDETHMGAFTGIPECKIVPGKFPNLF
jgi:hypothetical protein